MGVSTVQYGRLDVRNAQLRGRTSDVGIGWWEAEMWGKRLYTEYYLD